MLFTPDGDYPIINIEKGMLRAGFCASYRQEGERRVLWLHAGKAANAVPGRAEACLSGISLEQAKQAAQALPKELAIAFREEQDGLVLLIEGRGRMPPRQSREKMR